MTPEDRQELIDRLRSLADGIEDGQTIQHTLGCGWRDGDDEYLEFLYNEVRKRRVKPRPLECWVNVYGDGAYHLAIHSTEYDAKKNAGSGTVRIAVHMREVVA